MKNKFVYLPFIFLLLFSILDSYAQSLDDTLAIDEIVITGMRVNVGRKNLPMNISLIPKEKINEIEESAVLPLVSRMIPSLFVNERGVTGFGRDGNSSAGNISIRGIGGSSNSQVLVLVDGIPQFMGIFGHPLPNNYVASDLDRVEIIRGPASILYGSNAMGGVLNFITLRQKENGLSGRVRLGLGSYNTRKLMANAGFKNNNFDFFISYNHDETDGHRENMDFKIDNSYIKAGYKLSKNLKLTVDFNIADIQSYDPGLKDSVSAVFVADMLRGKSSLSLSNHFTSMEGGIFAYINFGDHDFSDGWISHDENYGLSFFEGLKLFSGNLITMGYDFKSYGGIGNIAIPPNNANKWLDVQENGAYLICQQSFAKNLLSINFGGRVEYHSLFGAEFIPQSGLNLNLSDDMSFKVFYSKGYRSPLIMELYLFAPNPELKPEEANNIEFGYTGRFLKGKLKTELNLYRVKGENLIVMDYTNAPPASRKNAGVFNHKGIEMQAFYSPVNNFTIDLSYSFLHMDSPKVSSPEHQLFVGLKYKFYDFEFALQTNYIGGLYVLSSDDVSGKEIKEDYLVLNTSLKYKITQNVEMFLSGKNLSNAIYQIDYGYPMPGINFMTGLGLRF